MESYFGTEHRWNGPTKLSEYMDIQPELAPYFNDYKIHVVDVAFLTDPELDAYRSDFRIAAEYFVQTRRTGEYEPRSQPVRHRHDVLEMMESLTGNRMFEKSLAEGFEEGREVTMQDMLNKIKDRCVEEGLTRGRAEGRADTARNMLINGIDRDMVAKCASLSLDRVDEIANDLRR